MTGKLTGAFVVALLAALGLSGSWREREVAAEDKGAPPAKGALPADLERVPGNAVGVLSVRIADVWVSDLGKAVRQKGAMEIEPWAKEIENKVGVAPSQMERLTMVMVNAPHESVVFITTRKPYDRAKVLAGVGAGSAEEKFGGETIYVRRDFGLHFLNDRTFMAGALTDVKAMMKKADLKKTDPLAPAVALAASNRTFVFGVNPAAIERLVKNEPLPPQAAPFKALLKARSATLTFDVGERFRADLKVEFADAAAAKAGQKSLEAARKVGQGGLAEAIKELTRSKAPAEVLELVRAVEASTKATPIAQKGDRVEASLEVRVDGKTLGAVALELVQRVRVAAARTQSVNNLKQIGIALHNYHDVHGAFPPAAVYDKDGKAILSWRVLILPYVEQDNLYRKFKLNEPWDGPNNKKLLALMPRTYAMAEREGPKGSTFYQVFAGPGAIFEGKRGTRLTDVSDGTSNTLLVVEAAKAVPWSKPEDLPYAAGSPVPQVGGRDGSFNAGFADGSVRRFTKRPKDVVFHALITRAGGEVLPGNFDE